MEKRDLIQAEIEKLGYFLQRLLANFLNGNSTENSIEAADLVTNEFKNELDFDLPLFLSLSNDEMKKYLSNFKFNEQHLEKLADLLAQMNTSKIYITKAMKIISFTSNITGLNPNSVDFSLTNVDFRGAKVIEWGFCYNISKLNTRVIHNIYKHKQTGAMSTEKDFSVVCDGLQPATSYYIRNYFKLEDGTVIYGPLKSATTTAGIKWSAENWTLTKTSASVRFDLVGYTGTTNPEMTLKVGASAETLNTVVVNNLGGFKYSSALLNSLTANTSYLAQVEVKLNDSVHVFRKTFKTLTDYRSFTVDNTSSGVKHRISWNTTLKQISPVGQKAEYPRILRVNADTLLCAYHGGANDFWVPWGPK